MAVPMIQIPNGRGRQAIARESVPAINMKHVLPAWRDRRTRGEWRTERGTLVALGELVDLERRALHLRIEWAEASGSKRRETNIAVSRRHGPNGREVLDAFCPGCTTPTATLYFFERMWRCAACHDLLPLKQLITPAADLNERYWTMHERLHAQSRFPRSYRTVERNRLKLSVLAKQLNEIGIVPRRADLAPKVHLIWYDPEVVEELDDEQETLSPLPFLERRKSLPVIKPGF